MISKRRHYNKALWILLTTFHHLREINHPLYHVMSRYLNAFDEYPVENFHSILRGRTNSTDTGEQIFLKAREIDICKHELHDFKSWFVPQRTYNFSPKRIKMLKLKAAQFLVGKFATLLNNRNQGRMIPRTTRQQSKVSKWILPNLFGDAIVTNKVLPLGYSDPGTLPSNK